MNSPGILLKTERERQHKSLENIARSLRISSDYLQAIEDERFDALPAEVFTRAYLRSYASALGLEGDDVITLYKSMTDTDAADEETGRVSPVKPSTVNPFAVKIIAAIGAVVLLILLFIMSGGKDNEHPPAAQPQAVSPGNVNNRNDHESAAAPVLALPGPAVQSDASDKLTLTVTAVELTWVSITTDSGKPEEWLLRKGKSVTLTGSSMFELKIGNAGGTRVSLNGRDIGTLGPRGRVVHIVLPLDRKQ